MVLHLCLLALVIRSTIDKVVENPQVISRNMIVETQHPTAGKLKVPGIPIKMSETPGEIRMPFPILSQYTDEILNELLEFSEEQINILRKEDVL